MAVMAVEAEEDIVIFLLRPLWDLGSLLVKVKDYGAAASKQGGPGGGPGGGQYTKRGCLNIGNNHLLCRTYQ